MATTVWQSTGSTSTGPVTGQTGFSHRIELDSLLASSLGQVRVTFQVVTGAGMLAVTATHWSIGVAQNGVSTPPNITGSLPSTTFQELTVSGSGGFTLALPSTTITDWVNLSFTSSDKLVVCFDLTTDAIGYSAGGGSDWYHASFTSWNTATVQGIGNDFTANAGVMYLVTLVETQSGAPATTLMGAICL